MGNERASIFESETDLDVTGFAPKPRAEAPRLDTEQLRAVAEGRGFLSREARTAALPAAAAAPAEMRPTTAARNVPPPRPIHFETRLTIRISAEAKRRFDDLAYRLRVPNGEAFNRLLDAFERVEGQS